MRFYFVYVFLLTTCRNGQTYDLNWIKVQKLEEALFFFCDAISNAFQWIFHGPVEIFSVIQSSRFPH